MKHSSPHTPEPWAGAPYPYMVSPYTSPDKPAADPVPQVHMTPKAWDPAAGESWAGGPYSTADYAELYRSNRFSCSPGDSNQNIQGK